MILYFYPRSELGRFNFVLRYASHSETAYCREIRVLNVSAAILVMACRTNYEFGRRSERYTSATPNGQRLTRRLFPENMNMAQTYEGFVKWFNNDKGYGFLSRQDGDDVFCHYSAINSGGFKTLHEDQKVRFEIEQGPKGLQAVNVQPLD